MLTYRLSLKPLIRCQRQIRERADPRPAVELEVNPQPSEELIFDHNTAQGTLERKWCLIQRLPIPREITMKFTEYHELILYIYSPSSHPMTSTMVFSCTPRNFCTVNLALHVRPELLMMAKMAWLMLLLLHFQWRANIWICCRKSQPVYPWLLSHANTQRIWGRSAADGWCY